MMNFLLAFACVTIFGIQQALDRLCSVQEQCNIAEI